MTSHPTIRNNSWVGGESPAANTNLAIDDLRFVSSYVYLGSPYSKYPGGQAEAASVATRAAAKLMSRDIPIFCPIAHSHTICEVGELDHLDWKLWKRQDQPLIDGASALIVLMMDTWRESVGLTYEIECFVKAGKPIVYVMPEDL